MNEQMEKENAKLPQVRRKADIEKCQGQKVRVWGTYSEMNVSKRPGADPVYVGRAILNLEDGSLVMLECDSLGIRGAEEIKEFVGKKVKVVGTLYNRCNAWGDGTQATIIGPCLRQIESIQPE